MERRMIRGDEVKIACSLEEESLHLELQFGEMISLSLGILLPMNKERKNTDE